MPPTIVARHCEISDALRERAISVLDRLGNLAPRPMESTIVLMLMVISRPLKSGCT